MTIFTEILRAVQAPMGVQGRNVLLFLGNCDAHPQDTSLLRNVKVVYYPPSGSTILHTLDLGTRQCFNQLYVKHLVQRAACFDGLRRGCQIENKCCVSDTFHNYGLAIGHESTVMHCFCQCSCGLDLNTQAGLDSVLKKRKMPSTRTGWARCTEGRQLQFLHTSG